MADLKTTNIFGDAYINNKVGIATNAPATRLQIGQLSPTAATEGIQFGDDINTRIYRSSPGTLTLNGVVAGLSLSASTALYGNYGDWSGESNKIQWHSNNLYFVNRGGGSWIFRNSSAANVVDIASNGTTTIAGNISAANLSGTNTGDQTIGNGTITIAAGTGVGVGTTNTFTTNQSGATTVTITNAGVTSAVAGIGVGVSAATGAVTFSIGQAVGTGNSPTFTDLFTTGNIRLRNGDPTITFSDTNATSSFIHVNSSIFHILSGPPNAAFGEWAIAANGRWPLEINLSNNNATFGGNVDAISFSGAGTNLTGTAASLTAGTATSANALNTSNNYQVNSIGIGMAGSGTAGKLSLNQAGVRSWSITPSGGRLVIEAGDGLGSAIFACPLTSSNFVGPGTGLTGTAASLTAGTATTATTANALNTANNYTVNNLRVTGNIGIGTTSPQGVLEAQGSTDGSLGGIGGQTQLWVSDNRNQTTGVGGGISFAGKYINSNATQITFGAIRGSKANSTSADTLGNLELYAFGGDFKFHSQYSQVIGVNTELVTIKADGKVGIGISTPSTLLHVNGIISGSSFSGAGTGLTGTAAGLSIGGTAAIATTANNLNTANNYQVKNLTVSERIALGNRNAIYSLWHGGNQDLAWKKIADITLPNNLYACASFRVDVLDAEGNFGWSVNCRPMTYFVACRRSGGTLNSYDDATVSGPINDYVRAVKTAQGVYELQIRQIQDWQILTFQVELITSSGTITYATGVPGNGSTTGTAYTVITNGYTQYLPNVSAITSSASLFSGAGTGLTGTAASLTAGTATTANALNTSNNYTVNNLRVTSTVGVGTTSPQGVLEVQGSTDGSLGGLGAQTQLWVSDNRNQTTGVGGGISFAGEYINSNAAQITFGAIRGSKANDTSANTVGNLELYAFGGDFKFHSQYSQVIGVNTELVTIKADGKVGIGNATPRQLLHINGSILLDGLDNGYQQSATRAIGYGSNSGTVSGNGFSGMDIQSVNAPAPNGGNYSQNLRFWTHHYGLGTGGTPRMFIQYDGNVGIGTTVPVARLHVNSTTAGSTLLRTDGTNGTLFSVVDDLSDSLMSVNNSAGLPVLEVFADDRVIMGQYGQNDFVLKNNRVGIGTTDFSYTTSDNNRYVGTNTNNRLFVSGSIQLLGNNDAIVFGRGTATFLTDEELGFGWGGGWYMTDGTYLRVRADKTVYTAGEIWASIFRDSNDNSFYLDPDSASVLKYEEGQNQYSFRGANRATNDWENSGLTTVPTVNDYNDGSWYIDAASSNNWSRGLLSKRRFRRVEGLTFEYESYLQSNDGNAVHCMIGFVGGNTINYSFDQTPANVTYQDNTGLSVFTNGGSSGTDYNFDTRNSWYRFKTVLKGTGAFHYVYRNGIWNLIKETSTNNQNDYEWVRVLISLYRQRIYFRDVKVYVAQNYYRGVDYISNIAGTLSASVFSGAGTGLTGTAANLTAGAATTATNSTQLGGVAAASYVTLTDTQTLTNKTITGSITTASYANALNAANNYSVNSLTEGGYLAYPLREYVINLSAQSTSNFYPVAINNPPGTDATWHNEFSVDMVNQGGEATYNMHSMYGEVRGQGWTDETQFYRVFHTYYAPAERSILGIWRGTQTFYGVVVYLRGGKNYYVRTTSRSVVGYSAAQTLGSAVFAIKNAAGADVSGTSANIGEMLNLINNPSGFYHSDNAYIGTNQVVHLGTTSAPNLSVGGSAGSAATATTASYANALNAANQYTVGGITGSHFGTSSWASNATTATTANTATALTSMNISQFTNNSGYLTSVTNISGNAGTATLLQNPKNIGGVSFNGSANIDLPGVNIAGNQNTSGTANTATTANALNTANNYTVNNLTVSTTAQLVGVRETYTSVNISSGVVTIDLNAGTVFRLSYNAVVNSFTINNITAGKVNAFTLVTVPAIGAGGINFTFTGTNASNPKWPSGNTPMATTTANKYDVFSFIYDGSNWYGFTGGLNY